MPTPTNTPDVREGELTELEWTDKFGSHMEISKTGADGRIHAVTLTKPATGWSPGMIENARVQVFRAALARATGGAG